MLKTVLLSLIANIFLLNATFAQVSHTISGYVKDSLSGENLIGVAVSLKEMPEKGAITNGYGFFSITVPEGNYKLITRYLGFKTDTTVIMLTKDVKLEIILLETSIFTNEVIVVSGREYDVINRNGTGMEQLDMTKLLKTPVILSEKDPLKLIQLLPGVKAANEGGSGFNVRGGGSDQNLILLDEATVYNPSHLFGFFSVFNPDAIKDATLYKGNIPAEYGGRISSVLDIKMKEGNNKEFVINGGIGLIASRLNVQGPIIKDKSSFIVSARRTYADFLLKLFDDDFKDTELFFYDINAKCNYYLDQDNRLFISGYFGKDKLSLNQEIDWGNRTMSARWNHIFNNSMFSNSTLNFSDYSYSVEIQNMGNNSNFIKSNIRDYCLKQDFQYFFENSNNLMFGYNSIYHIINPGTLTSSSGQVSNSLKLERYSWENSFYISHDTRMSDRLTIEYGTRLSFFSIIGPGDFLKFNSSGSIIDTLSFYSRSFIKTYANLEPRISINYLVNETISIKSSYRRTLQYLHLISSSSVSDPTDIWLPSSMYIKPEIGDQISLGYFRNFLDNMFEFSIETYFTYLQNQIDYKDGAQLEFNNTVESELLAGKGRTYGLEVSIKKKTGRLNGWISYCLSRSEKKFESINNGNYFPAKQDRLHDLSFVISYDISQKWSLSANWIYYSGNAVTFPSGKYEIDGKIAKYYTERNGYRMPDYHRLDVSAVWQLGVSEKSESNLTFSIYNLYNRMNPFFITFRQNQSDPIKTESVQLSLFGIVPSISYNFKF